MGWRTQQAYEDARNEARRAIPLGQRYAWRRLFVIVPVAALLIALAWFTR